MSKSARRRMRGVTLIEILITMLIGAVLLSLATPGFSDFNDKRRVKAVAEGLYADLQFARSEAIKRNQPVRLVFQRSMDGKTWCYGMTHANTCDCRITDTMDPAFCYLNVDPAAPAYNSNTDPVRHVSNVEWPDSIVQTVTYTGGIVSFSPPHATAPNGRIDFRSTGGKEIHVTTSGMGRVRMCSPSGAAFVPGYPVCS